MSVYWILWLKPFIINYLDMEDADKKLILDEVAKLLSWNFKIKISQEEWVFDYISIKKIK